MLISPIENLAEDLIEHSREEEEEEKNYHQVVCKAVHLHG